MNEELKRIIEKSGATWAASRFDRSLVPVLVRLERAGAEAVYELRLEPGASHPYWSVAERQLSTEEAFELLQARQRCRAQLSVRLDVGMTSYIGFGARAWIKNGRSDEWLPHVMKAHVEVVWEDF